MVWKTEGIVAKLFKMTLNYHSSSYLFYGWQYEYKNRRTRKRMEQLVYRIIAIGSPVLKFSRYKTFAANFNNNKPQKSDFFFTNITFKCEKYL